MATVVVTAYLVPHCTAPRWGPTGEEVDAGAPMAGLQGTSLGPSGLGSVDFVQCGPLRGSAAIALPVKASLYSHWFGVDQLRSFFASTPKLVVISYPAQALVVVVCPIGRSIARVLCAGNVSLGLLPILHNTPARPL